MNQTGHDTPAPSFWRRPVGMAVATVVFMATFSLLREHWGHVLGFWPYLVLMACPLLHLLHGHGGHVRHHQTPDRRDHNKG